MELREIGDVAVIASFPPGPNLVSRVDLFEEEAHSLLNLTTAHQQARRAFAVNLNNMSPWEEALPQLNRG